MRRLVRAMVAAGTISTAVVAGGSAPAFAGAGCDASFHMITSPNAASGDTQLGSVAAWNTSNAWAVGDSADGPFSVRWDGSSWREVHVRAVGRETFPMTVIMAGSHDVWAFGEFRNPHGRHRTFALHRTNGVWVRVPTPNLGGGENYLFTASVIAPDDIWAGGGGTVDGVAAVNILHWNGNRWRRITVPTVGSGDNSLGGLATVGPGNMWIAVTSVDEQGNSRATTFHRVGWRWRRVNFQQPSSAVEPQDMVALGPSAIWMVGYYVTDPRLDRRALLERYDGTRWVRFRGVNPDPRTRLMSVAALNPHDVYAVGQAGSDAIVEHYDGTSWKLVTTHQPALSSASILDGSAAASSGPDDTRIWGVGVSVQSGRQIRALIEQSCP